MMNPVEVLTGWWGVLVLLVWRNSKAAETQHHIQCQNPKRPAADSAALSAHHVLVVVWWPVAPARRWRRLTPSSATSSQQDALIDGYSLQRISAALTLLLGMGYDGAAKNMKLRFISRFYLCETVQPSPNDRATLIHVFHFLPREVGSWANWWVCKCQSEY